MLGAAAGFQLLDGLIGDARLLGELRLAEFQRGTPFSYAIAGGFHVKQYTRLLAVYTRYLVICRNPLLIQVCLLTLRKQSCSPSVHGRYKTKKTKKRL